jgi:hypothetical protein
VNTRGAEPKTEDEAGEKQLGADRTDLVLRRDAVCMTAVVQREKRRRSKHELEV